MNIGFLFIVAFARLDTAAEKRAGMFAGQVGVYGACYKCAVDLYYQRFRREPESTLPGVLYQQLVEVLT